MLRASHSLSNNLRETTAMVLHIFDPMNLKEKIPAKEASQSQHMPLLTCILETILSRCFQKLLSKFLMRLTLLQLDKRAEHRTQTSLCIRKGTPPTKHTLTSAISLSKPLAQFSSAPFSFQDSIPSLFSRYVRVNHPYTHTDIYLYIFFDTYFIYTYTSHFDHRSDGNPTSSPPLLLSGIQAREPFDLLDFLGDTIRNCFLYSAFSVHFLERVS